MKKSLPRIVTGLIIILVGLAFVVTNLGVVDASLAELWVKWWPSLLVVGGILMLINDIRSYVWALFIMLVGAVFQVDALVDLPTSPWNLIWPLVLVFVGLSITLKHTTNRRRVSKASKDEVAAILGGTDKRNVSEDYQGSVVTAVLGGARLDLSGAKIAKRAEIDVTVVMGGLELVIPKDVIVHNQTTAILGGVDDGTNTESKKGLPELFINGDVILGGIEIKH